MEALSHDVLKEGLRIQQALLPEAVCASAPVNDYFGDDADINSMNMDIKNHGMFFHSPFLYWNCSIESVEYDRRILKTVNENNLKRSSSGITLRFGSVFAGKQFSHQKLIAADALVVSMFYDLNSTIGDLWDQRAIKLAQEAGAHGRYKVFPPDGKEDYSNLYEVMPPAGAYTGGFVINDFIIASFDFNQSHFLTFLRSLRATYSPRYIWPYHYAGYGASNRVLVL